MVADACNLILFHSGAIRVKWTKAIVPMLVAVPILLSAILAYQLYSQLRDRDEAVRIAEIFLLNGETFRFDGLKSSIIFDNTIRIASGWRVGINFTCAHPGYGDRTGQSLPQVISLHQIQVTVQESKVSSAIIDGEWDEVSQQPVVSK